MILLYIIKEAFLYAINSLIVNKLRTFLSLLGITIGIFCIISVSTLIDSLEDNIRNSISSLGDNVIYVQKWPWSFGSDYPWWKYISRPVPKLAEAEEIKKRSQKAEAVTFQLFASKSIQYKDSYMENILILCNQYEFDKIRNFELEKGRYFTNFESQSGSSRLVIGAEIAKQLFINENPVGKEVKLMGRKALIIGVFKKEGTDMFGSSLDKQVVIPVSFARNLLNIRDEQLGPLIMVKAKAGVTNDELMDELQGIMRAIRRLKPLEDDNFALNRSSLISQGFEPIFKTINISGTIIGGLAIIVGAFGIANIMFVSVKEQTPQIGIQKAIGAKRLFILLQFLYEAVILSLIGGIVGLLLIFIVTVFVSKNFDFQITLTVKNIIKGLLISIVVGIISGLIPARNASKLNPVEAITNQ